MNGAHLAAATVVGLVLTGCGTDGEDRLFVSAASSLTEIFADAELDFERTHPEIDIELNLAGSGTLVNQIVEGAPVGIVATADRAALDPIEELVVDLEEIAVNRLVFIHRTDSLPLVTSLDTIADDAIVVACDPSAPCGRTTRRVLDDLDLDLDLDSLEPNVRAVLRRVVSGGADAGFVYRTDVPVDPGIAMIDPDVGSADSTVVVAAVDKSEEARTFLGFVRAGGIDDGLLERGFELR